MFSSKATWNASNPISSEYKHVFRSKPLCLNNNKFTITRECTEAGWIPATTPHCSHIQTDYEDKNKCPRGYQTVRITSTKNVCVFLTLPNPWKNKCLNEGSSSIFYNLPDSEKLAVLNFIREQNYTEVWMPAKRFTRFGSVIWTIAGELHGEPVEYDTLAIQLLNTSNVVENGCFSADMNYNLTSGYYSRL